MADKPKASLIFVNVPTENFDETLRFYNTLLGGDEFARSLNESVVSYFRPISEDGIDLTITQRYDVQERCIPYYAVENLDRALAELQGSEHGPDVRVAGNKKIPALVVKPTVVEGTLPAEPGPGAKAADTGHRQKQRIGRMAVILDPGGNHVGLMELEEHARRHFKAGARQPLSADRVREHQQAKAAGRQLAAEHPTR